MKRTILTFGLISGVLSSMMMVATVPFMHNIGYDRGAIIGYSAIVLSFLLVFFGIRSYRDNVGNGRISFGRAFAVGICITVISCLFYVATWEVLYYNFLHDFWDKYSAFTVAKLHAAGASPAAVQAQVEKLQKFKVMYDNPFFNAAMTFIEPFPVGLLITLLSSAILRKNADPAGRHALAVENALS